MTATRWYRISSVLLVLFALAHTAGFWQIDPSWGADSVVSGMKSVSFRVQGVERSYWDFFFGFGLFASVFLLFAAILAWRLGSLPHDQLSAMSVERWSFAISFVVIAILTWRYVFAAPGTIATLVALCLVAAAWKGGRGRGPATSAGPG